MLIATPLIVCLYVLVSWIAIELTPISVIQTDPGNMLGISAKLIAGEAGFIVIGLAALLASAAAVNATIFTASKVLGVVVNAHPKAQWIEKAIGSGQVRPLLISAVIVIALVLAFPLEIVGKMASMAFLILFAVITFGHLRIRQQTGTQAWILWCGVIINASLFIFLFINGLNTNASGNIALVIALLATFLVQVKYHFTKSAQH
jgi:hypothetical protein